MSPEKPAAQRSPWKPSMSWLLVFLPVVLGLEFSHSQ